MEKITLGRQIERLRKKLGFSQEKLAEETRLNLRTIQRIENDETIPRADSLKRITDSLNVTPDEIIEYSLTVDKSYLNLMNLSSFGFFVFPLLGVILPLIFWIMKRDKIRDTDFIGKKILNFQISWCILLFGFYFILFITSFFRIQHMSLESPLFSFAFTPIIGIAVCYFINFVYNISNIILINKGKVVFYKPAFRFLR
jgi:transcriptional regulator with XRE-family HTH domain